MSISRLCAHHVRIPLRQTVRHASYSRSETDSLIVRCELEGGHVGWGEGLPRQYVTGETIDDVWRMLQEAQFVERLETERRDLSSAIGQLAAFSIWPSATPTSGNVSELKIPVQDLKSQVSDSRSDDSDFRFRNSERRQGAESGDAQSVTDTRARGCYGNSLRCALEIALLDAHCRREGVPLSRVTQLLPQTEPIRQQSERVRYSGMITAMSSIRQIGSALKQRVYGFSQVKVKVGVRGADDVALLRRVRRIVGSRVDLRIDANAAWSCASLEEKLRPLEPFHLSAIEQPVPHAEVGGLCAVRERIGVPIMLDESLCSGSDAQRAIDEGLCDLFNIRLSKCGGFLPSLRLAVRAHAAGLGYQLGCQVGETGILSAAGRHFATSVGGIRALEGSYDRHLVRERLTNEDLTFGYGGWAPALRGAGLGVTVDETALARVTVRSLSVIS